MLQQQDIDIIISRCKNEQETNKFKCSDSYNYYSRIYDNYCHLHGFQNVDEIEKEAVWQKVRESLD